MPIAHHDLDHLNGRSVDSESSSILPAQPPITLRRLSEESLPTELCEGPIPDSPQQPTAEDQDGDVEDMTSSREELIERLKKGGSPIWIPKHQSPTGIRSGSPESRRPNPPRDSPQNSSNSSNLLPAAQITPEKARSPDGSLRHLKEGLEIERPRSALQWGDFTRHEEEQQAKKDGRQTRQRSPTRSETRPPDDGWLATSPPRNYTPFQFDERRSDWRSNRHEARSYGTSPLSVSPALSSSFAYQPPTSPLVTSQTNEDLEISEALDGMQIPASRLNQRRHTLYSAQSSPFMSPSPRPSYLPKHRRQGSFQAHQPRRSLTSSLSFTHAATSPTTPNMMRPLRRTSFGSESSPISRHAAMVGSYEESILRGRMSTTPSKPLEFLAQIAVLGKGDCKPSLRCPAHVTLPFPAVYYSYSTTSHGRSLEDDSPSPYVGNIDLENGLNAPSDSSRSKKKAHNRYADRLSMDDNNNDAAMTGQSEERDIRRASRTKRRSEMPRAPPGGSYRIPEKGQLQIVIKNGNKTAVKLFLIPYDLTGMEPGTKTFIRQRCSSFGPIIEGAATPVPASLTDKSTLRYLIHVHICCPSKGRFYLYKNIRVVFANRVPDGKEKLKSETTWPTPRFTPYKPIRVMNPPIMSHSSSVGATLVADKASRRRSAGYFGTPAFDASDGIFLTPQPSGAASSLGGHTRPIEPIPFHFPASKRPTTGASDTTNTTAADLRSPDSHMSRPTTKDSGGSSDYNEYVKLNKGDHGYGGRLFSQSTAGSSDIEGLLSQRLRSLGQQLREEEALDDPDVG